MLNKQVHAVNRLILELALKLHGLFIYFFMADPVEKVDDAKFNELLLARPIWILTGSSQDE
jgi:hypothetical protein